MAGMDTLTQVRLHWRIEDVYAAGDLLDARELAERQSMARAEAAR